MKQSAGIVIIYENKILLIHPSGGKGWYGSYSFPKGGLDKGETILQAALREVHEEIGIKLKKSQLDKKMHKIEYVSKGKKSWGKAPKGQIYKTVYYWTCHIKDLKEIGLTSEVVNKSQLQASEVDWAGFVPAKEISKRIAPVMGSIIKHINMNEALNEAKKLKGPITSLKELEELLKDLKKTGMSKHIGIESKRKHDGGLHNLYIDYNDPKEGMLEISLYLDLQNGGNNFTAYSEEGWSADDPVEFVNKMLAKKSVMESVTEDLIPGGLSDKHSVDSIAKLHGVSVDVIAAQIKKGVEIEKEHVGNNLEMAAEISMDHLVEMPDYYDRIERMEKEAEAANENYSIMSLAQFVNEKYYTYADFEKSKWGDPEEMKSDAEVTLRNMMPRDAFKIKSVTDQSGDKGIKFEFKLSTGDTVHAYKNSNWRGEYEWFVNKKKMDKRDIQNNFFDKLDSLDKYLRQLKGHDWYYQYADDNRAFKSGQASSTNLANAYSDLSSGDKKKAYKEFLKLVPKDYDAPEFKTFKGI
jgi:8-oxo-dGTP pyrophosphatase MutT (NUDIX family)